MGVEGEGGMLGESGGPDQPADGDDRDEASATVIPVVPDCIEKQLRGEGWGGSPQSRMCR